MDEEETQIEEIITKNETERTPPRDGQNIDHEMFCENNSTGDSSVDTKNEDTSKTNDCDQNETEISEEISEICYKRSSVRKPWRSPTLENEGQTGDSLTEVVPSPENSLDSDLELQLEENNFQETQDSPTHTLNNNNNESHPPSAPEIDLIADLLGRITQESLFLEYQSYCKFFHKIFAYVEVRKIYDI